jgi:hypothetical protein
MIVLMITAEHIGARPSRTFAGLFFALVVAPGIALITIAVLIAGGVDQWTAFAGLVVAPIATFARASANGSVERASILAIVSAIVTFGLIVALVLAVVAYASIIATPNDA